MRLVLAVAIALPLTLASQMHAARQVPSGSPAPSGPVTTGAAVSGPPLTAVASTPQTTASFTLLSSNPTAVPLASITANQSSLPTQPIPTPATAGAIPSFLPGAPPLPDISNFDPTLYPPLDKVPPTDSPEVQQWWQEVQNSGIIIPNITQTVPGGCPANPAAAQDQSRCWWTCSGCTRPRDITDCPTKNTWGLTYDDGPGFYTTELLDYLGQVNLKTTFFTVGSRVVEKPAVSQAEYMSQHQIAIHTYSHPVLTTLTNFEIVAELGWTRKVLRDVLGVSPNQWRPPYGDIDDRVRAIGLALGMVPVMWTRVNASYTFDTGDFNLNAGTITPQQVLSNWDGIMAEAALRPRGFCALEHDLFEQTVEIATGYLIPDGIARNLTIQPVITCQGKPLSDAYVETNNNQTNPTPSGSDAVDSTPTAASSISSSSSQSSHNSAPGVFSFSTSGAAAVALMSIVGVLAGMFTIL